MSALLVALLACATVVAGQFYGRPSSALAGGIVC
jgi:hypothetical protein